MYFTNPTLPLLSHRPHPCKKGDGTRSVSKITLNSDPSRNRLSPPPQPIYASSLFFSLFFTLILSNVVSMLFDP
eukprot:750081-Hanusia_phi.AAC.1